MPFLPEDSKSKIRARCPSPNLIKTHKPPPLESHGLEGHQEVVSATDGKVALFWPSREDRSSVIVQDAQGFLWEYGHLASAAPEIVLGAAVTRGQKIGMLGRTGPSGNFSHLHLGTYLSRGDIGADRPNRRLNLYPWIVAAYQAEHPKCLLAVARPHQERSEERRVGKECR